MKHKQSIGWLTCVVAMGCTPPADDDRETGSASMADGADMGGSDVGSSGLGESEGSGGGEDTGAGSDDAADSSGGDTGATEWPDELPVNCTALPDAPECARPIWIEPGTIGGGQHLVNGAFPELGAGFLDAENERIVIAAKFGSDSVFPTGGVATIDLHTGDRTIVTGSYYENYATAEGFHELGDGAPIDAYYDVKPGPDGWYAVGDRVMSNGEQKSAVVVHIDPSTGHREVVWDELQHTCDDGSGVTMIPNPDSIAVAPDGRVLLNIGDNPLGVGHGLVAVSPTGCVVVSRAEGAGPDVGSGGTITDDFTGMDMGGGLVWGVDWITSTLTSIDPTTGNRTTVSSSGSGNVGTGPDLGNEALAYNGDVVYTYAGWLTEVDVATGNRTDVPMGDGPLSFAQSDGKVLPHANPAWVVVLSEVAVTVLDKQNGNNNILSY